MPPSCRKRSGQNSPALARKYGVRFVGLFLTADLATRLARIEQRRGDASDATRECRPDAGDFRDRRGGLAHDRCLGDAGPVAPQRPYFVVCGAGRALTMRDHPTGTSSRRKAAEAAGLDCAAAFQKIALDCVAAIKAHHTSACAGDAEAVHQIRVAITRLRAAVAFFAPIVVDAEWLRLKQEIAWLNGPLGAARDSDVVVEYARRKRYRAWAQRMIGEQLDKRQTRDHRRLVRCLRSAPDATPARGDGALDQAGNVAGALQASARTRKPLQAYCARELNRWHERLVRKGRHLKTLGASRRHRLRIKAKRFRYMLEALDGNRRRCGAGANSVTCTGRQSGCSAHWATSATSSASPTLPWIAAGRKWQTRQEASAGLSPSKGKAARRRHRGSSRPQARPATLTPPFALPLDIVRV